MPDRQAPEPLDIDRFVDTLARCYPSWDAPIISFISARGATPFEILVSTILSLRTRDQTTAAAATRLMAVARTPRSMLALPTEEIEQLIYPVGFYKTKARRLREISRRLLDDWEGRVPDEIDALLTLPGVGRKTANLVVVEGFGKPGICVDTHVHRISNRIGYVDTGTPEKTEFALRRTLPRRHWVKYNEILVAFGQVICQPVSPHCSRCPVAAMCPRVGVTKSR